MRHSRCLLRTWLALPLTVVFFAATSRHHRLRAVPALPPDRLFLRFLIPVTTTVYTHCCSAARLGKRPGRFRVLSYLRVFIPLSSTASLIEHSALSRHLAAVRYGDNIGRTGCVAFCRMALPLRAAKSLSAAYLYMTCARCTLLLICAAPVSLAFSFSSVLLLQHLQPSPPRTAAVLTHSTADTKLSSSCWHNSPSPSPSSFCLVRAALPAFCLLRATSSERCNRLCAGDAGTSARFNLRGKAFRVLLPPSPLSCLYCRVPGQAAVLVLDAFGGLPRHLARRAFRSSNSAMPAGHQPRLTVQPAFLCDLLSTLVRASTLWNVPSRQHLPIYGENVHVKHRRSVHRT